MSAQGPPRRLTACAGGGGPVRRLALAPDPVKSKCCRGINEGCGSTDAPMKSSVGKIKLRVWVPQIRLPVSKRLLGKRSMQTSVESAGSLLRMARFESNGRDDSRGCHFSGAREREPSYQIRRESESVWLPPVTLSKYLYIPALARPPSPFPLISSLPTSVAQRRPSVSRGRPLTAQARSREPCTRGHHRVSTTVTILSTPAFFDSHAITVTFPACGGKFTAVIVTISRGR